MTIKNPATRSRTQEPLRFPGLRKPPNLRCTDKTSLKADREVWDLTLASLETPANLSENGGTEQNGTGGSAAPREPAKPKYHSKNKGPPLYTPQNPCRKHQGSSIISQNNFLFDFANKVERKAKGHGSPTGGLMTIKSPATGSRSQEPFRFPGLSKPPTSDPWMSMDYPWISTDCLWISMDHPWISMVDIHGYP